MLRHHGAVPLAVPAPDRFVDALPVKHLRGVHGQQLHDVEFLFGQVHRLAVLVEAPGAIVDDKPLVELHLGLALSAFLPAQVGRHPGQQLLGGEGL